MAQKSIEGINAKFCELYGLISKGQQLKLLEHDALISKARLYYQRVVELVPIFIDLENQIGGLKRANECVAEHINFNREFMDMGDFGSMTTKILRAGAHEDFPWHIILDSERIELYVSLMDFILDILRQQIPKKDSQEFKQMREHYVLKLEENKLDRESQRLMNSMYLERKKGESERDWSRRFAKSIDDERDLHLFVIDELKKKSDRLQELKKILVIYTEDALESFRCNNLMIKNISYFKAFLERNKNENENNKKNKKGDDLAQRQQLGKRQRI